MTRLALDQAPEVSLPRRFLLSMPAWGVLAGIILMGEGDALFRSRWYPGTLALVHACTLGLLGNAMFGSLLQFLPAAAGVRVRGVRFGRLLHALLNAGALLLVYGLDRDDRHAVMLASMVLPMAFLLLAGMTLPGLYEAATSRLLRAGMGAALFFGSCTALLGGLLALAWTGAIPLALPGWADAHASFGILGWVVLLLASVARVVLPMFQGAAVPPARGQGIWLASLAVALPIAAAWRIVHDDVALRGALLLYGMSFAACVLWLQRRTAKARRGPLWWSWRIGASILLLAAALLIDDRRAGWLPGVLALGVALPMLTTGMALEIVAFLGWIELHRRVGRGVQLPGVQRLMPARDRGGALLAQLAAAVPLVAVAWHPAAWLDRLAGLAQCLAWLAVSLVFMGAGWRSRRFLGRQRERGGEHGAAPKAVGR